MVEVFRCNSSVCEVRSVSIVEVQVKSEAVGDLLEASRVVRVGARRARGRSVRIKQLSMECM